MRKFKPLALLNDCLDRFLLSLVGNPEDPFSHVTAHFVVDQDQWDVLNMSALLISCVDSDLSGATWRQTVFPY